MDQNETKPDTRPDAAALKEDVPEGAVRSDTGRPADVDPRKMQISGSRSERDGLSEPKGVESEGREGERLGDVRSPTPT